jgi:hypothetical protein
MCRVRDSICWMLGGRYSSEAQSRVRSAMNVEPGGRASLVLAVVIMPYTHARIFVTADAF